MRTRGWKELILSEQVNVTKFPPVKNCISGILNKRGQVFRASLTIPISTCFLKGLLVEAFDNLARYNMELKSKLEKNP